MWWSPALLRWKVFFTRVPSSLQWTNIESHLNNMVFSIFPSDLWLFNGFFFPWKDPLSLKQLTQMQMCIPIWAGIHISKCQLCNKMQKVVYIALPQRGLDCNLKRQPKTKRDEMALMQLDIPVPSSLHKGDPSLRDKLHTHIIGLQLQLPHCKVVSQRKGSVQSKRILKMQPWIWLYV